ncbi:hypothetical protein GCG54_00004342 [Colletotrichum gloeosporioides]|uniref:Gamma-glutamylcyclotransferase AIG2-like domain-containing protein n=1 Tax=Colletotrichum gloeosporioides TaxID=474922 RepID=A0A8H4CL84_COLGL|nr:uncharacterized protein GCG54_00004342 [Colletotrichum gloeosporioides]KAF3806018.1 hypothetical protein GCG54_00004342 [Colletotrichum gloeosporioides]
METSSMPVFIYGPLCAKPLPAWVLIGDATLVDEISQLIQTAIVKYFVLHKLNNCNCPAPVKKHGASINGYVVRSMTQSQRRNLESFDDETYRVKDVQAVLTAPAKSWKRRFTRKSPSEELWDLEWFIEERLEDWIAALEGEKMAMMGGCEN